MTQGRGVVVVFEDDQGTTPANPGPTALLKALITDREFSLSGLWTTAGRAASVQVIYSNGSGKLLNHCRPAGHRRLSNLGEIIVVLDRDKAHRIFPGAKLAADACRSVIRQRLLQESEGNPLELVLLEDNLETVLATLCELLGVEEGLRHAAVERKSLNERDIVLHRAASRRQTDVRERLMERVPSFKRLVDIVCKQLGLSPVPPEA